MKRVLLLFFLVSSSAFPQVQHGTLGVVYMTKEKIVVAADSRSMELGVKGPPNDSQCKIAAPHGKFIFLVFWGIGYRNHGFPDTAPSWKSIDEIYKAYDAAPAPRVPPVPDDVRMSTLTEWMNLVSVDFRTMYRIHRSAILNLADAGHGVLARGAMFGFDSKGTPSGRVGTIAFDEGQVYSLMDAPILNCPNHFCSYGHVEIVDEFVNLKSPRARKEATEWKPPKGTAPKDYDILKAMRLVELAIQDGQDVGGKVDAVEMLRNGDVRWFAIKSNCRKD